MINVLLNSRLKEIIKKYTTNDSKIKEKKKKRMVMLMQKQIKKIFKNIIKRTLATQMFKFIKIIQVRLK